MRLRSLEDVFVMKNYLENLPASSANNEIISAYDRSYGIQKIFDLHGKKDYKVETLFVAAGILDRYIYMIGA